MFSADFMRPEVWHALSVHFPIALLPMATLTVLVSFFINERYKASWQIAATLLLFAGCLSAWIAVYTGNVADGIVARKLCDPTVLKDHEIASQNMTWLFTIAAILHILSLTNFLRPRIRGLSFYLAFIFMLVGTGFLVYTGHVGASLVYEQGAGVKNHETDCADFE